MAPGIMPFLAVDDVANWVRFPHARISTPLCAPSRSCLLTGQRADVHGRINNSSTTPPWDQDDHIGTWMQAAGYRTGLVGKYLNDYPWDGGPPFNVPAGWDTWWAVGHAGDYLDWTAITADGAAERGDGSDSSYLTDRLATEATAFIGAPDERPFFLLVAPVAPHSPYTPPTRYVNTVVPDSAPPSMNVLIEDGPRWQSDLPPVDEEVVRRSRQRSRRTLLAVDDLVRRVIGELRRTGALERTIVLYMTDNGVAHGQHRLGSQVGVQKKVPLTWATNASLRVRVPQVAGRDDIRWVSSLDVTATIASWAGATPGRELGGVDISELVASPDAPPPRTGCGSMFGGDREMDAWWSWEADGLRYSEYPETAEVELYDLGADPDQTVNVARHPDYTDALDRMAGELAAFSAGNGLP